MSSRPHLPYVILRPVSSSPRTKQYNVMSASSLSDIEHIWTEFNPADEALACDIETNGLLAHKLETKVQQIGFSDSRGAWSIDFRTSYPGCYRDVLEGLMVSQVPLCFFNGIFDLAFLFRDIHNIIPGVGIDTRADLFELTTLDWFNYAHDAYSLERHLSNEGFIGQEHGLKYLQQALLGWEDRGDVELEEWLVTNGCVKKNGKADKGQMWKAPKEVIGPYNCADADSTWQLLTKVLLPRAKEFQAVLPYQEKFLTLVKVLIVQQLAGFRIDKEKLEKYNEELLVKIEDAANQFLTHEQVAPHVADYNQAIMDEHLSYEPEKFKSVTPPDEPPKFTKTGAVSKRWEDWQTKWKDYQPEVTARWLKWEERRRELGSQSWFNLNSGNDKKWLFYDRLGHEVVITTDSGQPAVDSDAALLWGEPGKLLTVYSELTKEQGYVSKCLELIQEDSPGNWRLHTQWKAPGANTGRLSGSGGFNLQQQPKTQGYLECFIPDEGCSIISGDVSALEPHVLAEASRDTTYMELYGPSSSPYTDVYLHVGAKMDEFKDKIIQAGYNPSNPTEAGTAAAKKECKFERGNILKVYVLQSNYGAGPRKIQQSLSLNGVNKPLEEVKNLHAAYWKVFSGIKKYESFLQSVWDRTGGYTINPIGHPVCVNENFIKDLVNRNIQSSGHMILVIQIFEWLQLMEEQKIPWLPLIFDYHDESIIMVRDKDIEQVKAIFKYSYKILNSDILKGVIQIKSDPKEAVNLAEVKIE